MSLIHEALEKAKKRETKLDTTFNDSKPVHKKSKSALWKIVLGLFFSAVLVLLTFYGAKRFYGHNSNTKNLELSVSEEVSSTNGQNQEFTFNSPSFSELYERYSSSAELSKITELFIAFPDSVSKEMFLNLCEKLLDLKDVESLNKLLAVFEEKGYVTSPFFLKLAQFYEEKDPLRSCKYYTKEYLASGNVLLIAKSATIFDRMGMVDSALKYYSIYLEKSSAFDDLYFQIKRRYEYLAEGRKKTG